MSTHEWVFPWIALAAGALVFAAGLPGAAREMLARRGARPGAAALAWPVGTWLIIAGAGAAFALKCGDAAGVDIVAVRGTVLGLLAGLLVHGLCLEPAAAGRRDTTGPASAVGPGSAAFGASTALVAAARLWLTHGEISGLGAFALGAVLSVLAAAFTGRDPGAPITGPLHRPSRSTLAALFLVILALTVMLGFSRASDLKQMYWADIPLLTGAAISIGLLLAEGARRLSPAPAWLPYVPLLSGGALAMAAVSHGIAHSWRPLEMTALGALVFGLILILDGCSVSAADTGRALTGESTAGDDRMTEAAGSVLLVAGSLVAFGVWSGYGLGLFMLGGWFASAYLPSPDLVPETGEASRAEPGAGITAAAAAAMAFGALVLVHRLMTLQAGAGIRLSGPGDTWDLFGIAAGGALPLALSAAMAPARVSRRTAGAEARSVAEWAAGLAASILLVGYVWGPRFSAAVLLGSALVQLVPTAADSLRPRVDAIAISGLVLSLGLFLSLPLFAHLASPTRPLRVTILLICAACMMARVLLSGADGVRSRKAG